MTELELYKFVDDNNLEYHYWDNQTNLYLFVPTYHLDTWNKLLGSSILDDGGIECTMKENYFCFEMIEICEWFGIEPTKVFDPNNEY